jgi:hypothetical protein
MRARLPAAMRLLPATVLLPLASLRLVRAVGCLTGVGLLTLMAAFLRKAVRRLVELLFALIRAEVIGLPIMLTLCLGLFGLNIHSAHGVFHSRLLKKVICPMRRRKFSMLTLCLGLFGLNIHSAHGVFHSRLLKKVICPMQAETQPPVRAQECARPMPELAQAGACQRNVQRVDV